MLRTVRYAASKTAIQASYRACLPPELALPHDGRNHLPSLSVSPPSHHHRRYRFRPRTSLPLHLRLQPIDLHLRVLAAALRRLDLFLQPFDFALDEVEPAVDGHDGVGAVLFEEDGADELVDLGGGGVGG